MLKNLIAEISSSLHELCIFNIVCFLILYVTFKEHPIVFINTCNSFLESMQLEETL